MPERKEERRRYIRLETPLKISYVLQNKEKILKVTSKDISPVGVRFEAVEKIEVGSRVDLTLHLPKSSNPVHAQGKLVWIKKLTLEDDSPYDAGIEFVRIEEDNKNTFLKFLCDLIYSRGKG